METEIKKEEINFKIQKPENKDSECTINFNMNKQKSFEVCEWFISLLCSVFFPHSYSSFRLTTHDSTRLLKIVIIYYCNVYIAHHFKLTFNLSNI